MLLDNVSVNHNKFTKHRIDYVLVDFSVLDLLQCYCELHGQEMFTPHVFARDVVAIVGACARESRVRDEIRRA